ncbi:hypothetical protein LSAT2_004782 [Lamellibrachia satsuma]|nr:hypothetical protein LSAT2_004782 [Lamellibrachia satsuma]
MDSQAQACAVILEDCWGDQVLGHGSPGSQVSYQVLSGTVQSCQKGPKDSDQEREVFAIVFAELVLYIDKTRLEEETAPVFKLADPVQLYQSRMEQLEVKLNTMVHST